MRMNDLSRTVQSRPWLTAAMGAATALGAMALTNLARARRAERENPPIGRFIEIEGVRLHYYERGQGQPLVLLHGNGVTLLDFLLSGFLQRAATEHRVIAFDRPGFGFSDRPRGGVAWTAKAQARLILRALDRLGIERPIVLGHSWGASVALAIGLQAPERLDSLVLVSGYYFPTERFESLIFAGPAVPALGDAARYTVAPLISRLLWPSLVAKAFAPQSAPMRFQAYPQEMSLRPSQLRATAAESALLLSDAAAMQDEYAQLRAPVTLIAGDADEIVSYTRQTRRLSRVLPEAKLVRLGGLGHMVHYFAAKQILDAIGDHAPPLRRAEEAEPMTPEPTAM